MKLPVLASAPCRDCRGLCCARPVPVTLHDLWRLRAVLGVEWDEVVRLVEYEADAAPADAFTLDDTSARYRFELRRKPGGACQFLVELPDDYRRCGVHGLHPEACRRYPFDRAGALVADAACPPELAARHPAARADEQPLLDEEDGEAALGRRVAARWEARVRAAERRLFPLEIVQWSERLYQDIEALRRGDRGTWHLAACRLVERA